MSAAGPPAPTVAPPGALAGELAFDAFYLTAIWLLVAAMARRGRGAEARAFTTAFALLALGDTGHVGMRLLAFSRGDLGLALPLGAWRIPVVGSGALATAVTVTLFYLLMAGIARRRSPPGTAAVAPWPEALVAVRLLLLALPQNEWGRVVPPQPWSLLRNLPLLLLVVGVALLFRRAGRRSPDLLPARLGALMLVSLACHLPVLLLVQRLPAIGLLMIPKSLAYLAMAVLAYRSMATIEPITAR